MLHRDDQTSQEVWDTFQSCLQPIIPLNLIPSKPQWPSCFQAQWSILGAHLMQPVKSSWSLTFFIWLPGPHSLGFQAFLIALFQFSLIVPPLNIGASEINPQTSFVALPICSFPKRSYLSLMALNGIYMLIAFNFVSPALISMKSWLVLAPEYSVSPVGWWIVMSNLTCSKTLPLPIFSPLQTFST